MMFKNLNTLKVEILDFSKFVLFFVKFMIYFTDIIYLIFLS